ncbi:MAG TPA: FtsW/RodA/SpoVE family cell cycle protein, partial [Bryobacteraceae bacterium]|nr:FtsW/RodA/SpoVE family cell cycle protein [Bryobacteraceae bacterium]
RGVHTVAPALNLNRVERVEQIVPLLQSIESTSEREFIGRRILQEVQSGPLPNVGALGRIRVSARDLSARTPGLRARIGKESSVPLLSGADLRELKPRLAVRTAGEYQRSFLLWCGLFMATFLAVHVFWWMTRFEGHQGLLPAVVLLSGAGLITMVSLRDPLRDTLAFADFAQGAALGCIALVVASQVDWTKLAGRLTYVPLLAAFLLSILLISFGTGPGASDAKVNLFGVQPVEAIKVLVIFFLAGYFARRWEHLRVLRETQVSHWVEVPRFEYLLPLLAALTVLIAFFFLQKDLGPALVISSVFLLLYAVARDRYLFAAVGFGAMLGAFLLGYQLGVPRTVASRVAMWLSPWDNHVRGGEQVVHALWAFSTGGWAGMGPGLGDPEIMPAAHTDLVLSAIGEEWGFLGICALALVFIALIAVGIRIATRARNDFGFFLALGFTLLLAAEALLITGGVLDLVPLSGVATPFLSYGKSAALANFFIIGVLLSLSVQSSSGENLKPFVANTWSVGRLLAMLGVVIVGKALWIQVLRADETVGRGTLTVQADGFRRFQYNPRLLEIARGIPRGTIYSAEGLPLATSDWQQVQAKREQFGKAGIPVSVQAPAGDARFYTLGAPAVHLLGDLRTRANWSARNSSLVERDSAVRLQGYDDHATVVEVESDGKPYYTIRYDFRELIPLLRHRWEPNHAEVRKVLDRERDVKLSIHAALQWRAAQLLREHLRKLGRSKGSVVVMDPENGNLLASVSYPWPERMPPVLSEPDKDDALLDRARYGLYPPGSTFKLVTALAALRKDPSLAHQTYSCVRLPDGRVGNFVRGWSRPIRDDFADKVPHGTVNMERGTVVSCNAYYAQLGTYRIGPEALLETAGLFGINVARPNTHAKLKDALPQASYGQGQVVASPFQMARVAAAVANGGRAPIGRWVVDETNLRVQEPKPVVNREQARLLAGYMRSVVTSGTGRSAGTAKIPIAGKTGTAELERAPSHAWFVGYAPADGPRKIAFAVLIENGQYGGTAAAPLAAQIVNAAADLNLLGEERQ